MCDAELRGDDCAVGVAAIVAGGDAAAGAGHHEGEVAEHHAAVAALHAGARRVREWRRHAEQAETKSNGVRKPELVDRDLGKSAVGAYSKLAGPQLHWTQRLAVTA